MSNQTLKSMQTESPDRGRDVYKRQIYIEGFTQGKTITFNIYGKETRSAERTVEYVSETLETTEADETRYVATEDAIGTMYTQNEGQTGLTAQLWKI